MEHIKECKKCKEQFLNILDESRSINKEFFSNNNETFSNKNIDIVISNFE